LSLSIFGLIEHHQQVDLPTERNGPKLPNLDLSAIDAQSIPNDEFAALRTGRFL
jgi:hypothetical protein